MEANRILYISPINMWTNNGMAQRQHQILSLLCSLGTPVDLLSLDAPPTTARRWLAERGIPATVLTGAYPLAARLNTTLWFGIGKILCEKLGWQDHFHFPFRTPLPNRWMQH